MLVYKIYGLQSLTLKMVTLKGVLQANSTTSYIQMLNNVETTT